jgi:hypothetical protein
LTDQNTFNAEIAAKNQKIADLSERIANSVTGGPTICYFMPLGNQPETWVLVSHGDFPLYEANAIITDQQRFAQIAAENLRLRGIPNMSLETLTATQVNYPIGSMPPKSARVVGRLFDLHGELRSWGISFSARNGFFSQALIMRKIGGQWASAVRVTRASFTPNVPNEIVFEQVAPGFPRDQKGDVDWNAH